MRGTGGLLAAMLLVAVGAGVLGAIGCTAALASRNTDPAAQLEAEIEVALDMLRDLMQYQNRFKASPADPAELATVDRQMREFVASKTAPGGGPDERRARLEKTRDMVLYVINDNAFGGARRLGLPEPKLTTIETLRAAIKARQ